ncbi:hypothetical protein [Dyadobacter psychrotolerans]|uniref:Uncharacterized protein n=1 Tax=Dyadobacter psychrotolerans TaxID=2541721 RepID=A0A4R5DKT8_9BACT|nr:hypothetical protein [Dyadobacter psychrotolerans]TDE14679.1 hypothetical protein E0F88_15940 [Dyadobacter psychrotolerans]
MDPIDYFRNEIKSYFPQSTELTLSKAYAQHRRFNFYFTIKENYPYLLYLNWDGEGERFTLKCLEFKSAEILSGLAAAYAENGSKSFNAGQPKTTVSFILKSQDNLSVTEFRGSENKQLNGGEIVGKRLMESVDPELPTE